MKKAMREFFADTGGSDRLSLSYYSPDVEAKWIFDVDAPDSLQVVYQRHYTVNDNPVKEDHWLYLTPQDAATIGRVLIGYAVAHGEE